jgi:hypothetical protein
MITLSLTFGNVRLGSESNGQPLEKVHCFNVSV